MTTKRKRREREPVVDADVIDADVVSGDWRQRAREAPKLPASDVLRALGLQVPDGVAASVFVDSTEHDGASIVLVLRPIPHGAVDVAKATVCGLWGRLGQAMPYLLPFIGPVLAGAPWWTRGGKR